MTAILESRLWRIAERAARAWSGIAMALALIACGGGDAGAGESGNARREGTFSIVAPMASARTSASSALLPDGRVLVAGGMGSSGHPLATTEIYNPATGQWSSGPTMATTRAVTSGEFLVRLHDGRVLALGNVKPEVYDPATDHWTPVATPPGAIAAPFVVLPNGPVVALSLAGTQAHVYDPGSNTWQSFAGLDGRRDFALAMLPDSRVLVSGGRFGNVRTASTLIFNPGNGQWQAGPAMNVPRMSHLAFALNDGRVVVSHGVPDNLAVNGRAEVYDPATNTWSLAGQVIKFDAATLGATCIQLADGSYLVTGGQTGAGNTILDQVPQGELNETNAEIFDPRTLQWRRATAPATGLLQPRHHHTATRLLSGHVLLMGGTVTGVELASVEQYNP